VRADLGWDDRWQAALDRLGRTGTVARIVSAHRGAYRARADDGVAWCEASGHAYHVADDRRALPVVGDWVVVDGWARAAAGGGNAVIADILPRENLLVRRAAGEATEPQPLVANVDVGIVMTSANAELSPARLDRYLALLADARVPARIVLSKVDLVAAAVRAELVEALAHLAPTLPLSLAGDALGLDAVLAEVGRARTAVLLGSSGVGKSTLVNALLGNAVQVTAPIDGDDRGRHATTRRELFAARDGSLWIDTPGMRELGAFEDDDDDGDDDAFDDIAALARGCRFGDCRHAGEPGCAVVGAVGDERLASFHKLGEEREVVARDASAARRIAQTRRAKAKRYLPRPGKPED
jgi:ribosome biogenesis GTPase